MTDEEKTDVAVIDPNAPAPVSRGHVFSSPVAFEHASMMAKRLAGSTMIPQAYRNEPANTLIAIEMAQRTNSSPMAIMQNMHIIQGKPSFSSAFIIGILNASKLFSHLRFNKTGSAANKDLACFAYARDLETGEVIDGPLVTWEMAEKEGWKHGYGDEREVPLASADQV